MSCWSHLTQPFDSWSLKESIQVHRAKKESRALTCSEPMITGDCA